MKTERMFVLPLPSIQHKIWGVRPSSRSEGAKFSARYLHSKDLAVGDMEDLYQSE